MQRWLVATAAACTLAFAACGSDDNDGEPTAAPTSAATPAASPAASAAAPTATVAPDAPLTVYWLGESFTSGAATYTLSAPVGEVGAIDSKTLLYTSETAGTLQLITTDADFFITITPVAQTSVILETINIEIGGQPATMLTACLRGLCPSSRRITMNREGVVVVANTNTIVGPNGEQLNPLMDQPAIMAVLEGLRPYPE